MHTGAARPRLQRARERGEGEGAQQSQLSSLKGGFAVREIDAAGETLAAIAGFRRRGSLGVAVKHPGAGPCPGQPPGHAARQPPPASFPCDGRCAQTRLGSGQSRCQQRRWRGRRGCGRSGQLLVLAIARDEGGGDQYDLIPLVHTHDPQPQPFVEQGAGADVSADAADQRLNDASRRGPGGEGRAAVRWNRGKNQRPSSTGRPPGRQRKPLAGKFARRRRQFAKTADVLCDGRRSSS